MTSPVESRPEETSPDQSVSGQSVADALHSLSQKLASRRAARQNLLAELGQICAGDDKAGGAIAKLAQLDEAGEGDEVAAVQKLRDQAVRDNDLLQHLINNAGKTLSLLASATDENAELLSQLEQNTFSFFLQPDSKAKTRIPRGYTIGFLSTMPRSGTWYAFHFFENFYRFLTHRDLGYDRHGFEVYPELALAKGHVHANCPGFLEHCIGPERSAWDALRGELPGYDYAAWFVAANRALFSPQRNPAVRIIYLYRNPLDQVISIYRHFRHHRDYRELIARIPDEHALLRGAGLDSYIKQFLTFRHMADAFPGNILMVSYEELMRDPAGTFGRMLDFWNVRTNTPERRRAIADSVEKSSAARLRELEISLGHSLGDDRIDPAESHMQSGEIGRWRQVFEDKDLAYAGARLQQFGLSLREFTLA